MLSWDDFRYVKAIADTPVARRRSRAARHQSFDGVSPARPDRAATGPAPVRTRPRRLCADPLRGGNGRSCPPVGRGHRHLRAPGHGPGSAPLRRTPDHDQRCHPASAAQGRADRLPPRLSGHRPRPRRHQPDAQSVEARRRCRAPGDLSGTGTRWRAPASRALAWAVYGPSRSPPTRSIRSPIAAGTTGSPSPTISPSPKR